MEQIVKAVNGFAFDLFSAVKKEQSGNIFFSPVNLMHALAMARMGKKKKTAKEMDKVLFPGMAPDAAAGMGAFLQGMLKEKAGEDGDFLSMDAALWLQEGMALSSAWAKDLKSSHQVLLGPTSGGRSSTRGPRTE